MAISKRLQLTILQLLTDAGEPMKTSEIATAVGRTPTAVVRALEGTSAYRLPDTRPAEWTIRTEAPMLTKVVPSKFSDNAYVVSSGSAAGLLKAWNDKHKTVGETLAKFAITPDTDPEKMALQLGTVAGSIAALAYALKSVADDDNWYAKLTDESEK